TGRWRDPPRHPSAAPRRGCAASERRAWLVRATLTRQTVPCRPGGSQESSLGHGARAWQADGMRCPMHPPPSRMGDQAAVCGGRRHPDAYHACPAVPRSDMNATLRPRHAFLGPEGTFAETALRSIAESDDADLVPMDTVADALSAVRDGSVRGAMVPFENSVEGAVGNTLDELVRGTPLHIDREVLVPVRLALLVRPGSELPDVRAVASHPHATAQCRHWLRANLPEALVLPAASTAEAAATLAAGAGGIDAAISGPEAANRYGLVELMGSIG